MISVTAVGDIMLGDHPACVGHGVRSSVERRGVDYLFARLGNSLTSDGIVFGNLETVLSDVGLTHELKSFELRGRPQDATALAMYGFNVLNVANNHALQHGRAAFWDSVERLRNVGLTVVGLACDGKCLVKKVRRGPDEVLFASYSLRPEKFDNDKNLPYARTDDETVLFETIRELRNSAAPVVLSLHWGDEYLHFPSREQISLARRLVDAGVALVLGHHPHVLQGVERYRNGVIVYSLGNFIFDKWQKRTRESVIFHCHLSRSGVDSFELTPVMINRSYQPCIASRREGEGIRRKIEKYSQALHEIAEGRGQFANWSERYDRAARRAYLRFRLESYGYFARNLYRYQPQIVAESFRRFVERRLGISKI